MPAAHESHQTLRLEAKGASVSLRDSGMASKSRVTARSAKCMIRSRRLL